MPTFIRVRFAVIIRLWLYFFVFQSGNRSFRGQLTLVWPGPAPFLNKTVGRPRTTSMIGQRTAPMYAYPCVGGVTLFLAAIAVEWMAGDDSSRISSFWHAHDLEARPGTSGLRFCGRHDILVHAIVKADNSRGYRQEFGDRALGHTRKRGRTPPHRGLFHGAHKVHGFGMHNLSPDKLPDNIPHFMPLPQCNDPASPNNDSGTGNMTAQYRQVWVRKISHPSVFFFTPETRAARQLEENGNARLHHPRAKPNPQFGLQKLPWLGCSYLRSTI
ncbi:hypothetical protein B0H14DRAFT_2571057 [Mycena olivaceomarginata]|nr:hypothetical protein B0H14DRAFT_2571057 [Mycena olivaceomarginata]